MLSDAFRALTQLAGRQIWLVKTSASKPLGMAVNVDALYHVDTKSLRAAACPVRMLRKRTTGD